MGCNKVTSKIILLFFISLFLQTGGFLSAQDSIAYNKSVKIGSKFNYPQLIIPVTLIGVGIIGLESDWLKYQNSEIKHELRENIDTKFTVDDFSQYIPMVSVYGLNLCGIKGRHSLKDRTKLLVLSYLTMSVTVEGLKHITRVERPDGSSRNSFPSGHTATAFMGAEFLYQEYKEVSPWIGVAGYTVAAGTGFFRMYNNRHWLTDVLAGAGVGILSTKLSYWLYPLMKKKHTHHPKESAFQLIGLPYYNGKQVGLCMQVSF